VADNVAYGLVNRRTPRAAVRERVAELLQTVGLPGTEGKYPAQLSGGQQQRIALARALATSPGLLLLDEPLSALDAIVRVHLRQEIRQLQRRLGVTTIMVTHDQEEALSVADRIVVMNHGVIEQVGTPEVVYREPATPFVADFVGRINRLPATLEAPGRLRIGSLVLGIHPRAGDGLDTTGPVMAYLRPEDIVPCELGDGAAASGSFDAAVEKLEFLGAYGLARVSAPALGGCTLTALVSRHGPHAAAWAEGATLRLRLRPEAVRLYTS
jgi:iron(III) transport system ATP-binding protein